jgi:hypothetical protein
VRFGKTEFGTKRSLPITRETNPRAESLAVGGWFSYRETYLNRAAPTNAYPSHGKRGKHPSTSQLAATRDKSGK